MPRRWAVSFSVDTERRPAREAITRWMLVYAGSKNKAAAFDYVNWMLKKDTQEMWLRQFYWLPANTQVKMPDDLKPIMPATQADIPKILLWDWLWINEQRPKLVDRWNKEMSG